MQLDQIYDNRNQDTNRYIRMNHQTPDFSGEKRYGSIGFPDKKYRLLFLSRFWNIYLFTYKLNPAILHLMNANGNSICFAIS